MSVQEFTFAITLSSRDACEGVLGAVAATVLRQIGCSASAVTGLREELHAAIGPRGGDSEAFDVQFRARPGWCDVIILVSGREIWRTSREIP